MEESPSQEEIEKRIELMKQNCIFCKIIKGEIDAKKIYEDDICIAIFDVNPATKGHTLLMPKEHYMMMPMVPDEVIGHLGVISQYITDLLKETFSAKEVTSLIANGTAAGQQSQHFLMHVIPRYENDGFDLTPQGDSQYTEEDIETLSQKLYAKLSGN